MLPYKGVDGIVARNVTAPTGGDDSTTPVSPCPCRR